VHGRGRVSIDQNLPVESGSHVSKAPLRFSIVVPAYNEASYVGAALKSLQAQDYPDPYEIIVVDNNSTDGTGEIAASYGVTVVKEMEPGVCQARQRGTAEARGEIVVSTDADTVQPPDWLSRIDRHFRRSNAIVGVAGPCRYQNPSWWADLYPKVLFGAVARVFALTGCVFYLSATNTAFRRSAFPGYSLTMTQGGDELDLLRRLRRRGKVIWDRENIVATSARRLQRGLVYNLFVTFITYYLLAYLLNRLSSRQLFGMAPAFRQERRIRRRGRFAGLGTIGLVSWRDRFSWRMGLAIAVIATTSFGLVRFALPAAVNGIFRFWASP
jgi:glycosyltransferase involved in cell wall biosynthesis